MAAETIDRDEVRRVPAAFGAEQMLPAVDLLNVVGEDLSAAREARDDQVAGCDASVDEVVRVWIDRRGVDFEVLEHRWRGDVGLGLGAESLSALGAPGCLRELDRRKESGSADGHRRRARLSGLAEWQHRSAVELGGDPSSACGQAVELRACTDR